MQVIPLQALPSQSFSIPLDNNQWDIEILFTNGTISVSFTLNNEVVIQNTRAVGGMRIIPAKYEEAGNFAILTQNFEVPDYTKFGTSQQLIYISADELALVRVPQTGIYTEADFDPIADLPLRFKPQGYTLA